MKINAVLWYLSGISMNRIAFLLQVSVQAVLNWIRTFAKAHEEKPEPTGKTIVLELDGLAAAILPKPTVARILPAGAWSKCP
jgi:hypothetical protein